MADTLRIIDGKLLISGGALNIWDGTGDPCCCCPYCQDGLTPNQMQVVLSGISNQACTDCAANFNKTFILDKISPCYYELAIGPHCIRCGLTSNDAYYIALILHNIGLGNTLEVLILDSLRTTSCFTWRKNYAGVPNCRLFASESIAFFADNNSGCNNAGSTAALVTSL